MCQSQTIQGVTFSNAEMQHSFAAAHSSSLVIETRLYYVPRPTCGDSTRELRPNDPSTQRLRSAASRSRRSVWRRTEVECHPTSGYISREAPIVNQPSANPAFEARPLKSASGWYVRVAWPNGKREHFPGFVTRQEAQRWIEDKARVWLSERCSPPETLAPFATAL